MAQQQDSLAFRVAAVLAMAAIIVAIMTWLDSDLVALNPPTHAIYQAQHLILY
jgi:hypothetical protein